MSFQSRQRKRKYKRLEAQARRKRSAGTAQRWYLTLAKRPGKCAGCGDRFERGADIVFRHEPMATLCVRCADRQKILARPSLRWERAQSRKRAA